MLANSKRLCLFALTLAALTARNAHPQQLAVAPPGSPRLTFDIISIHPSKPPGPDEQCYIKAMPGGQGYLAHCISLKLVISLMYKLPERQITDLPAWVADELIDLEARTDRPYNIDDLHTMVQTMLADRFGLKFHTEQKEGNIYALTIDSSGIRMKPNSTSEEYKIPIQGGPDGYTGTRVPMNYLCWTLGQFLEEDHRPVINMTGLTGIYDFKLVFLPDLPPDTDKTSLPPGFLDRPNLFTAVREQLGLKLTAQKGPITYMVVDHIDKPSQN